MRVLRMILFLEVGFVLIVMPWSMYWDRNFFADALPALRPLIINHFVRGAVSGLGVVNVAAGILELFSLFVARGSSDGHPDSHDSSPGDSHDSSLDMTSSHTAGD
jgi:hypothetical protein